MSQETNGGSVNLTTAQKMTDYIGYTNAALEKAAAVDTEKQAQDQAIADRIDAAVDALVDGERIDADEREKAAAILRDPVQTLELLTKVAQHRNPTELGQQRLGEPTEQTKQASAVRQSTMSGITEADRVLFQGLGLAVPSN